MSRIGKSPITVPSGVQVVVNGRTVEVSGPKGKLSFNLHPEVEVTVDAGQVSFNWAGRENGVSSAQAGTARAIINNMVTGVSQGFQRKLVLVGVGYKVSVKGNVVNMALGYSHPIEHVLPEGVTAECPSQTEIVLSSIDKHLIGQTAANIRAYRSPEPYKGKGVRYSDEVVRIKETKKK